MNSYRRLILALGISLSLLGLISNTAHTTVRLVDDPAHVDKRSGSPALDRTRPDDTTSDQLFGRIGSHGFIQAAWTEPFAALPQASTTFTVNSTADPGTGGCDLTECTLREAIAAANALVGTDTIAFNIPSPGPYTIRPTSVLPIITSPVVIDGYTQPGASANTLADGDNAVLMIELNGSLLPVDVLALLSINAGSSTVRGLVLNRGSRAISMDTNGGNTIEGNFIGTNVAGNSTVDGSTNLGNDYGVLITIGSSNNVIGGTTPAARNLISGNNFGVALQGGPSTVQGNFIGTDLTGSNDLGNSIGVSVTASHGNTIGGTLSGARNVISGNPNGIRLQANNNVIQGNYIGVNATGGAFNGTGNTFGVVNFGTGTTIGGTTPAARNVISGHNIGIAINGGPSTTVQGNFIGTDASGTVRVGNTTAGIDMQLSNNTVIGGTAAGAGNLISANGNGIQLSPGIPGITNQIQGNLIGTDVTGTANLGNTGDGISVNGTNITIGGTTPGARNVISGNNGDGIDLRGVTGGVVQGNFIGTQIDGTSPLGNSGHGINMVSAPGTTIGGTTAGAGNRIAFNGAGLNFGGGVIIEGLSSNNNVVRGNSIYANTSTGTVTGGGLGIDLSVSGSANGPTLNDSCDSDTGPNNRQNFPVLTSGVGSGGTTTITGSLNSTASTAFTIDFYSNPACDSSGYGEGQTFLGSTTVNTDGSCNANINVALPVTLAPGAVVTATATDPQGNTSEFSRCIPAVGMNPPAANNDSHSTNEDTALNVPAPGVLANDTDADPGTTLSAQPVAGPSNGTLTLNPNGSFNYTPAGNFNGSDSFTYRASDGTNTSNTATVNITVNPVNDPPTATNDSITVGEDSGQTTVNVLANDSASPEAGETLSVTGVTQPANGVVTLLSGVVRYAPNANFNGSDSFTYTISDGNGGIATATVNVTVTPVNDAPVANDQSVTTDEDTAKAITLTASDVDGDTPIFSIVTPPAHGVLSGTGSNQTYTPATDYNGADTFTFKVNDGTVDSNTATVSITVNAVNDPPSFTKGPDQNNTEDAGAQSVANWATNVSAGPANESGQTLSFTVTNNNNGLFSAQPAIGSTGTLSYTPATNANGTAIVSVSLSDNGGTTNGGQNTSATQTFTITVNPINDAPLAANDSVSTNEDTMLVIAAPGVLANDTDVDNASLNAIKVSDPGNGTLALNADGSLTYTPNSNFNGSDSFTYKANDGSADSNSAVVTITVNPINDPPVAVNESYSVAGNSTLTVSAPGVLSNDTDVEGSALTASLASNVSTGTLSLNQNGSFTYTPNSNTSGTDGFTYRANDGSSDSNVAAVTITVTAAPTPTPTPTTVQFDSTLYSVQEDCTSIAVTVTRTGTLTGLTTVDYLTTDSTAEQRTDYTLGVGRLTFAPGEATKRITLLISEDFFTEGNEFFTIGLGNVTGGTVGAPGMTTVNIIDDPSEPTTNAIDQANIFICQHYHDFLNREPEPGGFQGWLNALNSCPAGSTACDRIEISSAFYRSEEFQQRGFFLYRFFSTALGRAPRYLEFMAALSQTTGFLTDQQVEAGKAAFIQAFMSLQEFKDNYDSLTDPTAYVNALEATAMVTLSNKQQLIDDLTTGRKSRADVLRTIADSPEVSARSFNGAFVTMQYFGYLRRDPDILYLDWMNTLNQTGDYRILVNGFVNSVEYRSRFGQP